MFAVMNWISGVGYSLFPLSESGYAGKFQDFMHLYVVTVLVVLLSIISLVFIIIGGFRTSRSRPLAVYAIIALSCMFIGAMGIKIMPPSYLGLFERFSTYSVVIFTAILGMYGFDDFSILEKNWF